MDGVAGCSEVTMQSYTPDQHENLEVVSGSAIADWTELAVPVSIVCRKVDVYFQASGCVVLYLLSSISDSSREIGNRVWNRCMGCLMIS